MGFTPNGRTTTVRIMSEMLYIGAYFARLLSYTHPPVSGAGLVSAHRWLTGPASRNSTTVVSMLNGKFIDDLARQISKSIPSGMKELQADVEKNVHTLLQGALGKLDLVTREDFDAQAAVLRRTREKLEELEHAIAELEKKNL